MDYGYCRCSTNEKKQDVEYQIKMLLDKGIAKENIFIEYESGAKEDRAEFNKLLKILKQGDSIYTSDISRLSRSTKQLCEFIDLVEKNKYCLFIGSMQIDCRTDKLEPMVEGMLKMMAVFAELERKMKIYQIKLGLDNAKANGKIIGRPTFNKDKNIPDEFYKYANMLKNGEIDKNELSRLSGKSRPTCNTWLNAIEN